MAVAVVAVVDSMVVVVVCEALGECSSRIVLQGSAAEAAAAAASVVVACIGQSPAYRILVQAMVMRSAVVLRNLTVAATVPKR